MAAGSAPTVSTSSTAISPSGGPEFDTAGYVPLDCQAKGDAAGDAVPAAADLVGDATHPATYVAHDATYLYLRHRVGGNPTGDKGFAPYSWVVLLQVPSGNPFGHQFELSLNGVGAPDDFGNTGVQQGDTIEIWKNDPAQSASFGPLYDDPAESRLFAQRHDYVGPGTANTQPLARIVPAADGSAFGGDPDYFVEFAVPISVLVDKGVITGAGDLDGTLYFPATSVESNRFNKDALDCRFALATDLALTTAVVPTEVPSGGSAQVSFTIVARNNGATSAKGVVIRDSAFAGYLGNFAVTPSSDDPSVTWTVVSTNPLEVDVPALPPGKTVRVVVGANAKPSCTDVASTNTASASATNADAMVATGRLGIGPAGLEVCDGRDNDCNGMIDDGPGLCDDGCVCTSDRCDPVQGCVHTPLAIPCMSGDMCTPLGPSGGAISGGTIAVSIDANRDVTVDFTESVDIDDNSYGTNIVNWPRSHAFTDLVGSDRAQFVFRDPAGNVVLDFYMDYISTKAGTPSGYASLGATTGDGKVNSGQLAWILDWQTSLAENLNTTGYCTGGACTVGGVNLLANSPPTTPLHAGYGVSAAFAKWKFPMEYRVKVSHLAFGAAGFGSVFVPSVQNSPPKIGANLTTFGNCPTGACGCFGGCDDGNSCTTDSCVSGQCQHAPISCDDQNPCTADSCVSGQCQHAPVTCDDGNPCTTDSCDSLTGSCSNVSHTGPCNDGNACTTNDTCATGTCVGTTLPDGTSCDDGNVCNGSEICRGGACAPGTPLNCDDGCFSTTDTCDPSTGCAHTGPCVPIDTCAVSYPFVSANPLTSIAFNESDVLRSFTATVGAKCAPDQIRLFYNDEHALVLGVRRVVVKTAVGTTTTDYPVSPLLTTPGGVLDPSVGATGTFGDQAGTDLSNRPMFPALFITDVTADPTSQVGDWQYGGTPIPPHAVFGTWKAAVRTVDKTLVPTVVTVTPDVDPAKNNWNLGGGDTAPSGLTNEGYGAEARWDASRLGLIAGHTYRFYFMVHDGDQNKAGGDAGQGCSTVRTAPRCDQPCTTAADCSDQNACNGTEACVNGTCRLGTPPNCDDGNPCTDDSCLAASGCQHIANTSPCDDGNACTTGDTCSNSVCVGGAVLNCNDSNPCTDDSCVAATGCINANNTKACSDGNACTVGDTCGAGTCHAGAAALGCNDNNPCTDDSCDPATGCVHANNAIPCSDGNACTVGDTCGGGTCHVGTAPLDCNDGNPCTDDSCAPATGCINANTTKPCDDGNACTVGDTCGGGTCHAGATPLDCNDSNPCTDDSCAPATGCVNANNTRPCDDGNACTVGDTCGGGTCHAGATPLACNDNNPCTDDSCDPATGCVHANNTNPCNDGNACTVGDTCGGGTCHAGTTPLDCNDGNPCTDDSCAPATGCINANNTRACDDGNACTVGDTCGGGTCHAGTTPLDCNDSNPCTDDSCAPATGCINANNTKPCSDGNACTVGDTCGGGTCLSGAGALGCNDGNPCTDDSCDPATGCINANNTKPCNDGNACTVGDTCGGGTCRAGATPLDCNDSNPCTDDSCAPATGCINANNTRPCSDGNVCTTADTCANGACIGGAPLNCDDMNRCTDDLCDAVTGCYQVGNSAPCNDDNPCSTLDTCANGICVGGPPLDCTDGNPCTDDVCNPSSGAKTQGFYKRLCQGDHPEDSISQADVECINNSATFRSVTTIAGLCDRLNPNPSNDKCEQAEAQFMTLLLNLCKGRVGDNQTVTSSCGGDATIGEVHAHSDAILAATTRSVEDCTLAQCEDDAINSSDESHSGVVNGPACVHTNNTAPCSDGNACTLSDTCGDGVCVGGAAPNCNDGNPCTDDSCDPATGCVHVNNTNPCNDGNACTVGDTCGDGTCHAGASALGCNDGNPCTDDSCDPAAGCINANNTKACSDGSACTVGDTCGAGTCHAGAAALGCNDNNPCTDDSCDPATGCINADNTKACSDGNACTVGDTCGGGTCHAGTTPLDCNDNNPCTDDSCDPAAGCINANNTKPCSDGNACTVGDTCGAGTCRAGSSPLGCNDGNPCTDDSCDPAKGCVHANNANPCSDGNACTVGDTCGGGVCIGGAALNCNDGNPCTDDSCDPASGCNHLYNSAPCDDGLSCTSGDTCKNGACAGNPSPPDCTEPKGTDFYRELCALGHAEEELSPATLACVGGWSTFRSVVSVSDVCVLLNPSPSGDTCQQAEAQLMAAVLNVCKGRLALDEPIRSSCTDHTTVGASLIDANQLLANPSRTSDDCSRAQCETKELNSGTASGMGTLTANRTAQGVTLDWSAPPFRAGWPAPSGYTVWRRPKGAGTFSAIAVATDLLYNDPSVPAGIDYEYQVTIVQP